MAVTVCKVNFTDTDDSTEPIYKHLANGWEKAFQRRLPHVLKACAKGFSNDLRTFHKAIEVHSFSHGGNSRLGLLAQQLTNYEAVFGDLGSNMLDLINERQRDINREFTPNVCNAMLVVTTPASMSRALVSSTE